MKKYAIVVALSLGFCPLYAQGDKCLTDNLTKRLAAKNPQYFRELEQAKVDRIKGNYLKATHKQATIYTIPVVFHVVYNTALQNVSDAAIYSQLNTLNADYRRYNDDASETRALFQAVADDVEIEFCLASTDPSGQATTGITRTATSKTAWDPDKEGDDMKYSSSGGENAWNTSKYLNIWIVNLADTSSVAGYAYIGSNWVHGKSKDGVVLDYQTGFGSHDRSLSHEVGHYLGLHHTWGDTKSCSDDDGFSDTPNSAGPNFVGCSANPVTCGSQDQFENYMDYSNCPNMFTQQQAAYMRSVLTNVRGSLLNSPGCAPLPSANFRTAIQNICAGTSVAFEDISIYQPTSWNWSFPGGDPASSSAQHPQVNYATKGNFNVTVIVTNSNGSDTITKYNYIRVSSIPALSISGTDAACGDASDGRVNVVVSGGVSPYSFTWSNGSTTQNLANLPAGSYSLTVTDRYECSVASSYTVNEINNLQLLASTQPDSAATGMGSASIAALGGAAPYTFIWSDNSTTASVNGLTSGNYSVTVTDASGCNRVKSFFIGDVAPVTAIEDPKEPYLFDVFPNPSAGEVNLRMNSLASEKVSFYLFNIEGVMIKNGVLPANKDFAEIDLTEYPDGVYYLRMNNGSHSQLRKVVLVKQYNR